jgi:cystathionine beta-lyase
MKKDTRLTHAGRHPEAQHGAVNPPVYHVSTVTFPTVEALEAASRKPLEGVYYGRHGTPTTFAFEEAVAELEGAERAIAFPSGLGALAGSLMAFVQAGDHILLSDSAYYPTHKICEQFLKRFGVETTYYDPMIGAGISALIKPKTKIVFVEAPGSLTFEVQDVPAIAAAAHAAGAIVILDNTWSAGYFFEAFKHGVDVSVQAATKYLSGHSDAMLGTVATSQALYERIKATMVSLGYSAAPDDCYLGLRGLRTLGVRMPRHQETGLKLARWLKARPEVDRILHPAFPDCPGHEIWKRDFTGASGLFGVVLKDFPKAAVTAMLDGLEHFAMGYSWGGFESLILPTDPAPLRTANKWPYKTPMLRISAGLEDADDLIADLEKGFARLNKK